MIDAHNSRICDLYYTKYNLGNVDNKQNFVIPFTRAEWAAGIPQRLATSCKLITAQCLENKDTLDKETLEKCKRHYVSNWVLSKAIERRGAKAAVMKFKSPKRKSPKRKSPKRKSPNKLKFKSPKRKSPARKSPNKLKFKSPKRGVRAHRRV